MCCKLRLIMPNILLANASVWIGEDAWRFFGRWYGAALSLWGVGLKWIRYRDWQMNEATLRCLHAATDMDGNVLKIGVIVIACPEMKFRVGLKLVTAIKKL